MDDKVTDANKRYCAVCINRGRTERDTDEGGIMHCRVYNLTGEKICIEKGYISFERDSQAQEAPRDFTVQEFAALPKKFRDHYLRMAAELSARDMEASQAQEAPKAASQSAESLINFIRELSEPEGDDSVAVYVHEIDECADLIEADRAAQRQAGREEGQKEFLAMAGDIDDLCNPCKAETAQRYAAVVEAARDYLKEHACSNSQGTCQDETNLRKALSALDEARKG